MFLFVSERIILEPEVTFKVVKIEDSMSGWVVHCDFIKNEKAPLLEEAVMEFERNSLKKIENASSAPPSSGLKYADPFPPSLSDILKLEKSYKAVSLEEAIGNAGLISSEKILNEAKEKMKSFKRIMKDFDMTKKDIESIFIYTLEDKEHRDNSMYNIVNGALADRGRKVLLPLRNYIFYLLQGLRSLPKFKKQDVLFRGVKMPQSVVNDTYREGRTLTWTSFSSTSTDESRAYRFAGKDGVIFEIHGKFRGYSIGTFSKFATEEGNLESLY